MRATGTSSLTWKCWKAAFKRPVMFVSLIYARSLNHCIGRDGRLPWDLPDEYAHFNRVTRGSAVIMGRKTYQENNHALPGRLNIVITSDEQLRLPPGVLSVRSLAEALNSAQRSGRKAFVLGGSRLFREAFDLADEVYESVVMAKFEGDTFIDAFDFSEWRTEELGTHGADALHAVGFVMYRHSRNLVVADI